MSSALQPIIVEMTQSIVKTHCEEREATARKDSWLEFNIGRLFLVLDRKDVDGVAPAVTPAPPIGSHSEACHRRLISGPCGFRFFVAAEGRRGVA